MKRFQIPAIAAIIATLSACEITLPEGLPGLSPGYVSSVPGYEGERVYRSTPRHAYRRVERWQERRVTGYQQLGPYRDYNGQRFVVIRRFYSDGSYEDSQRIY